jgi:hypothetical protein
MRALTAMKSAHMLLQSDPDGNASRAYYAAFNAVSALFALSGRTFPLIRQPPYGRASGFSKNWIVVKNTWG